MLPYFILLLLLSLFAFLSIFKIKREQYVITIIFSVIILWLFAGLRFGDADYGNYESVFYQSLTWNLEASPDIGFSILNLLLGTLWQDPLIMFLFVSLAAVCINIKSYNDYAYNLLFITILFYFVHSYLLKETIQIRSGLACAIGLYNIRNMQNGRWRKYFIFQLIAMSIHLGAIMYFAGCIALKLKITKKNWSYILLISLIIGTIYPFGAILKSLPGIDMLARVQTYSQWDEYAEAIGIFTNLATIKQLAICLFVIIFYERLKSNILYFDTLATLYFISTCWLMIWCDFAIVGARLATFLSIGEPLFIASSIYLAKKDSRPIVVTLLIFIAFVLLQTNISKLTPYNFYF